MLIDYLYAASLQGDHKLEAVKTDPSGLATTYDLHLEDKVKRVFDLVVGADGA
jgi:hypothetical protein